MKILVALPSFDRGGAESYCLRLISFVGNGEVEWHVTSANLRNAQLETEFERVGAVVHQGSPGRWNLPRKRSFKNFLRVHDFDVVMTLTGLFGAEVLEVARSVGVRSRIAWHRRSSPAYSPSPAKTLYAWWSRWQLERSSTHILSNSEAALLRFHGDRWRKDARFRVIHNGVDSTHFRPRPSIRDQARTELGIPGSAIVVGHVGRYDPAKDHETLFATVKRARDAGMDAWLICAGTGTDSNEFGQRVMDYELSECTRRLGPRSDIERLHQAMDIFLFPSITEGQPNALIEAMLSGVRLLASNIPPVRASIPEFLHDGLFPPRDADAASRLLLSTQEANCAQTEQARDWAMRRYDPGRNFNAVMELIGS